MKVLVLTLLECVLICSADSKILSVRCAYTYCVTLNLTSHSVELVVVKTYSFGDA